MTTEHRVHEDRTTKEALWTRCLRALGPDMRPCVLHGYKSLDELLESDVDCILPSRHLPTAVARRLDAAGIAIVQYVRYEATAHSFILGQRIDDSRWGFLRLDIASDFRYSTKPLLTGRTFFTEDELTRAQRPYGSFNIPTPDVEFGYYLIKRIAKGDLSDEKGQALTALYRQDPSGCRRVVARFWGEPRGELLCEAAATANWTEVRRRTAELRAELLGRSAISAPARVVGYLLRDVGRLAGRWVQPAGLCVALVGGNGAGGATLARQVAEAVAPAFNGTVFLRPGSRLRVRPARAKVRLVISDSGPVGARNGQARTTGGGLTHHHWERETRPDLVVRLEVPADARLAASQQASLAEPDGRPERNREPAATVRVLDVTQPTTVVVAEVGDAILEYLVARTAHRLGLAPGPSHPPTARVSFPSPGAPRGDGSR
jgi:hypothetical protein